MPSSNGGSQLPAESWMEVGDNTLVMKLMKKMRLGKRRPYQTVIFILGVTSMLFLILIYYSGMSYSSETDFHASSSKLNPSIKEMPRSVPTTPLKDQHPPPRQSPIHHPSSSSKPAHPQNAKNQPEYAHVALHQQIDTMNEKIDEIAKHLSSMQNANKIKTRNAPHLEVNPIKISKLHKENVFNDYQGSANADAYSQNDVENILRKDMAEIAFRNKTAGDADHFLLGEESRTVWNKTEYNDFVQFFKQHNMVRPDDSETEKEPNIKTRTKPLATPTRKPVPDINQVNDLQNELDGNDQKSEPTTKVLLVTYMRGGSTFLGELLNQNPDVLYWFEPIAGMYLSHYGAVSHPVDFFFHTNESIRILPEGEEQLIFDTLDNIFSCKNDQLSTGTLTNLYFRMGKMKALSSYGSCLMAEVEAYLTELRQRLERRKPYSYLGKFPKTGAPSVLRCNNVVRQFCPEFMSFNIDGVTRCVNYFIEAEEKYEDVMRRRISTVDKMRLRTFFEREACLRKARLGYQRCQDLMQEACDNTSVRAVKAIRLQLKTVIKYIKQNPDVKVIYFVRDPRGIIQSRIKIRYISKLSGNNPGHETWLLCKKMKADLDAYETAEKSIADRILFMKYEDLASDPFDNLHRIYSFLGMKNNNVVTDWLRSSTNAKSDDKKLLGTQRSNSSATAYTWMKELNFKQTMFITSVCKDVLARAGYPFQI